MNGIDNKDEAAMQIVCEDYEKEIGVKAKLVKVFPLYGKEKGVFQGYNIVEDWR